MTVKIIFGVVFVLISLMSILFPRQMWRMSRWQYKNPDANEPSEAAFVVQRVVGVVVLVVGLVILFRA